MWWMSTVRLVRSWTYKLMFQISILDATFFTGKHSFTQCRCTHPPPPPESGIARYRTLSASAGVHVSPIQALWVSENQWADIGYGSMDNLKESTLAIRKSGKVRVRFSNMTLTTWKASEVILSTLPMSSKCHRLILSCLIIMNSQDGSSLENGQSWATWHTWPTFNIATKVCQ